MKYSIAIASLTACWLTAASALGQDYYNSGEFARFMAEGDAIIQSQQGRPTLPVKQYDPEAAVALGIEPVPPKVPIGTSPAVIAAQARAGVPIITPPGAPQGVSQERWQQYQFELQRYNAALARYNEQRMQGTQRQAAEQQAAEQQRQLEAQRQQQQQEANEQWRQYYAAIEQQTKQFEDACQASRIEAAKRYPELADPNSELTKKYLEIQKRLTEEHNPIMDRSDYPKRIADMAATELKITPKQ